MKPLTKKIMIIGACIAFIAYAVVTKEFIGLDHAFAILTGIIVSKIYFAQYSSQKMFDSSDVLYFDRRLKNFAVEEVNDYAEPALKNVA